VTIKSVDTSDRAVVTLGTNVSKPITIAKGTTARIVMTYRVTDCDHAPEVLPVNLRIDRWWGTQTVTVQDHGHGLTACTWRAGRQSAHMTAADHCVLLIVR